MTAAEFFTWLRNTGEYESFIERQRQQEKERQKRAIEWQRAPGATSAGTY